LPPLAPVPALAKLTSWHWFFSGGAMKYRGKVKFFNESKGWGFIKQDDGPEVFVHYSNIQAQGFRTLKENDDVEFELSEGGKGPQATNVTKN
jgi:CspA family cold shock protein